MGLKSTARWIALSSLLQLAFSPSPYHCEIASKPVVTKPRIGFVDGIVGVMPVAAQSLRVRSQPCTPSQLADRKAESSLPPFIYHEYWHISITIQSVIKLTNIVEVQVVDDTVSYSMLALRPSGFTSADLCLLQFSPAFPFHWDSFRHGLSRRTRFCSCEG